MTARPIHEQVFWARRRLGLTQAELANQVGISRRALGQLENGQTAPRSDTLDAIAQALGVDLTHHGNPSTVDAQPGDDDPTTQREGA